MAIQPARAKKRGYPAFKGLGHLKNFADLPKANNSRNIFSGKNIFVVVLFKFRKNSWKFMGIHVNSWVFMGLHGSSWVFMRLHASSCEFWLLFSFFHLAHLSAFNRGICPALQPKNSYRSLSLARLSSLTFHPQTALWSSLPWQLRQKPRHKNAAKRDRGKDTPIDLRIRPCSQ